MKKAKRRVPQFRFKGFSGVWQQRRLGELTTISSASRVHRVDWRTTGVRFLRASDLVAHFNHQDNNAPAYISQSLYNRLTQNGGAPEAGDVLITGGGSVGIPYLVGPVLPIYFKDADVLRLKKSDLFDSQYLYDFLQTSSFRRYLKQISHVGTIAHFTIEQAGSVPINLPSLPEQRKIVALINLFDQAIALRERKLEYLTMLTGA